MSRKILHLDLDAFFCAVEEQRDPSLHGKPFAVGGKPEGRGVVASCSYPARAYGIHSAMPMAQALRLCPDLIILPPRREAYVRASREVMARLQALTPWVEPISIDEAFLDVSDLPDPLETIARKLQAQIREELGLPCSLGGATNKLVAKIANDEGKRQTRQGDYPNAITIVPPGEEASFLAPLPVRALWGVGPKTETKLHGLGIFTIGELAAYPQRELARLFGQHGYDLVRRAQGIDNRPVVAERGRAKSISKETTFTRDVADGRILHQTLTHLAASVARALRRKKLLARTVKLKLRLSNFTTLTRQTTLTTPTDNQDVIAETAIALFDRLWQPSQPVRLVGVGVSNLQEGWLQLSLWDDAQADRARRLQEAVDALQARFGPDAIHRGFGDIEK